MSTITRHTSLNVSHVRRRSEHDRPELAVRPRLSATLLNEAVVAGYIHEISSRRKHRDSHMLSARRCHSTPAAA